MSDLSSGHDGQPGSIIPFPPRRRSFIASPPPEPVVPPADSDDDIPVLTEVVDLASVSADAPSEEPEGPDLEALRETLADALAAELAHSIEQRLAAELPSLVEATLANLQDDLKQGIIAATEAALRDFISRRQPAISTTDAPSA